MEYVLGLFPDAAAAERAAGVLRHFGVSEDDYRVRTQTAATRNIKGWAGWLFDTPEPRSGPDAEGLPHEDAYWYNDRIRSGETMVAVRLEDRGGAEIARALQRAGGHDVRRYWTRFIGKQTTKTA
ncbi:MAG TPA: hypothetical protein VGZ23_16685 [bacterium]|nr:hypothetical protein [bacterium]